MNEKHLYQSMLQALVLQRTNPSPWKGRAGITYYCLLLPRSAYVD